MTTFRSEFFRNDVTSPTAPRPMHVVVVEGDIFRRAFSDESWSPTTGTTVIHYTQTFDSTASVYAVTPRLLVPFDLPARSKWQLSRDGAFSGVAPLAAEHARLPKDAFVLRSSFQGMARLPCYRGARPR